MSISEIQKITSNSVEYKTYEVKSFDDVKGEIKGYGVTYGNVDRVNDVIVKGALQDSIDNFNSGAKISFLFEHLDEIELNTSITSIQDDEIGSLVEAKVSEEAKVRYPRQFKSMVESYKGGKGYLSVGYSPLEFYVDKGVRYLTKISVKEFSFTSNPANYNAKVLSLKNMNILKYPVMLSDNWDSKGANDRWKMYSNSNETPSEVYSKAFLYHNVNGGIKDFSTYDLQIVDIVDGEPVINEKAVTSVCELMQKSKHDQKVIPYEEMPRLQGMIQELYSKINRVRVQEGVEALGIPDFKAYTIDYEIDAIKTKAYAEKIFKRYGSDMSQSQRKRFIGKMVNIGKGIQKQEIESKQVEEQKNLDNQNNSVISNPTLESQFNGTRTNVNVVHDSRTINFDKVLKLLKQ